MSVAVTDLMFGLKFGTLVPEQAPAYWGARAIYRDSRIDFLPDRQDMIGDDEDRRQLRQALIDAKAHDEITRFFRHTYVSPSEAAHRMIFENERVAVAASPNGSYGYLYLTAWLKEKA